MTARLGEAQGHNLPQRPGAGNTVRADLLTEGAVGAALGTAWAHSVNIRLLMERRGDKRILEVSLG